MGKDTGGQPGAQKTQEQPKADNTPLILEAIQREIARVAGAIETQKDDEDAKRKEAREIRDVQAQEAMAQWAESLFWATCASIILTLIGVFLIWRTLVHTRRAADAAGRAVDEARGANEAAREAVQVTRETSSHQLRAYVSALPEHISSFDENSFAWSTFKITNVGITPAKAIRQHAVLGVFPSPLPDNFVLPAFPAFAASFAGFQSQPWYGRVTAQRKFTATEIAGIRDESLRIYAFGEVEYLDIFGKKHLTKFGAWVRADAATFVKLTSNHLPRDLDVSFVTLQGYNDAD